MNMRGFSLLELTLIIILMGILGVVAVMKMPPIAFYQTQGFAGVFLKDLNLTKSLSMSENQKYRIVIGASSYQIQDQNGAAITHPETGTAAIVYARGVTVTPTMTLIFDSLGQPYDGAGVALTTVLTFTVTSQGTNYTVSVSPQTGFVQ
ncbi:hypothetical protein N9Q05_00350 [bacterium]|nr:hypothetical protein [bacterium]